MKISTTKQVFAMVALLTASSMASAQNSPGVQVEGYCDPQVAQALVEEYKARQRDRDETLNPLLKSVKEAAEDSFDQLSSCVDMSWPTMSITYPTMDQIIRGVAKQLVNRACGEARKYVTEANSAMNGSYYMNTRIPGVPNFGVSTYGSSASGAVPVSGNGQTVVPPRNPPTP